MIYTVMLSAILLLLVIIVPIITPAPLQICYEPTDFGQTDYNSISNSEDESNSTTSEYSTTEAAAPFETNELSYTTTDEDYVTMDDSETTVSSDYEDETSTTFGTEGDYGLYNETITIIYDGDSYNLTDCLPPPAALPINVIRSLAG